MKKIGAFVLTCLVTINLFAMDHFSDAFRYVKKKINPDATVTQPEEISRSIGIFKEFVECLRTKKLQDLKRDPQFLQRIYQINSRSYQIGETTKGCIQNQRYVESSKAREILINHTLATSPFITWLTYKALYEDGRITKEVFDQYCKLEEQRFYFLLKTLIPNEDKKKFAKASQLLDETNKTVTVNIVDSTNDSLSNTITTTPLSNTERGSAQSIDEHNKSDEASDDNHAEKVTQSIKTKDTQVESASLPPSPQAASRKRVKKRK